MHNNETFIIHYNFILTLCDVYLLNRERPMSTREHHLSTQIWLYDSSSSPSSINPANLFLSDQSCGKTKHIDSSHVICWCLF